MYAAGRTCGRTCPPTTASNVPAARAPIAPAAIETGRRVLAARLMAASWVLSPISATKMSANVDTTRLQSMLAPPAQSAWFKDGPFGPRSWTVSRDPVKTSSMTALDAGLGEKGTLTADPTHTASATALEGLLQGRQWRRMVPRGIDHGCICASCQRDPILTDV